MAVRGANQRKIDRHRFTPAQRRNAAFLQHPQQPRLHGEGHIADFVQKQRAAVGFAQPPDTAFFPRSGECATGVAKQFGFDQVIGNRGAVNGDKGFIAPMAAIVNRPR